MTTALNIPWVQLDGFPIPLNNSLRVSLACSIRPLCQQEMRLCMSVQHVPPAIQLNDDTHPSSKHILMVASTRKERCRLGIHRRCRRVGIVGRYRSFQGLDRFAVVPIFPEKPGVFNGSRSIFQASCVKH